MIGSGKIVTIFYLVCCSAILAQQMELEDFRVTFGKFSSPPKTEQEAKSAGWTKIGDCTQNSKFRGIRYILNNDYGLILLFDIQGNIPGVQSGISKAKLPDNSPHGKQIGQMFQEDGQHFFLTAYFNDPAIICSNGTRTGLYIQNGSDPMTNTTQIPAKESGMAGTKWVKGKCVSAMGYHYHYNPASDMNCDYVQPVFLLYNKDHRLIGFAWSLRVSHSSNTFARPAPEFSVRFYKEENSPECLLNARAWTVQHIYFTDPMTIPCF